MRTARKREDGFQRFAFKTAEHVGSSRSFVIALVVILTWAITGPIFHYSDAWQLVINTGTTIVTFLMVFLIQATQNRDARALHLKLDELIRTSKARNAFADLEHATEEELAAFEREFKKLREKGVARTEAAHHAGRRAHEVREENASDETQH